MKIAYVCPSSILKEDRNYPYLHTKIIATFKYCVASTENHKATEIDKRLKSERKKKEVKYEKSEKNNGFVNRAIHGNVLCYDGRNGDG